MVFLLPSLKSKPFKPLLDKPTDLPKVVALRVIVSRLALVEIHVPGYWREGTVYPGSVDVVDHHNSKSCLTFLQLFSENVEVSDRFV